MCVWPPSLFTVFLNSDLSLPSGRSSKSSSSSSEPTEYSDWLSEMSACHSETAHGGLSIGRAHSRPLCRFYDSKHKTKRFSRFILWIQGSIESNWQEIVPLTWATGPHGAGSTPPVPTLVFLSGVVVVDGLAVPLAFAQLAGQVLLLLLVVVPQQLLPIIRIHVLLLLDDLPLHLLHLQRRRRWTVETDGEQQCGMLKGPDRGGLFITFDYFSELSNVAKLITITISQNPNWHLWIAFFSPPTHFDSASHKLANSALYFIFPLYI